MGRIPQYFQVLLRVKYKGGVPTETSYLLHRELKEAVGGEAQFLLRLRNLKVGTNLFRKKIVDLSMTWNC
jgi:hypothetical protein